MRQASRARSLWTALDEAPAGRGLHLPAGPGQWQRVTWAEVRRRAERVAGGLRGVGIGPGDPVAAVLTNDLATVTGILGTWLAGAHLLSLPAPARGLGPDAYVSQLAGICRDAGAEHLAVSGALAEAFAGPLGDHGVRVLAWDAVDGPARPTAAAPPASDDAAFVQFSSGSTSRPKGCVLTPAAIAAQLQTIHTLSASEPGGEEAVATWLPLSHDMGMFGCLLFAWAGGYDLVLSSPDRFLRSPRSWLEDCATFGATLTAAPSAGLHVASRAAAARPPGPLSLRTLVLGGERVDWPTVCRAIEALAPSGLEPHHLRPAYGLAEATLAVTATRPDEAPSALHVDALALAEGEVVEADPDAAGTTSLVSCGAPCPGVGLAVDGGGIGRLRLSSPSLASGYLGADADAERWDDGWFRTDDVAFVRDGALYLTGRLDDVLVIAGRNVPALDLEDRLSRLPGVRRGCCTLVDVPADGGAHVTLLVELGDGAPDPGDLLDEATQIARPWGVPIHALVVAEPGATPKTPSGKVQRYRCRQALGMGTLAMASHAGGALGG